METLYLEEDSQENDLKSVKHNIEIKCVEPVKKDADAIKWKSCCFSCHKGAVVFVTQFLIGLLIMVFCIVQLVSDNSVGLEVGYLIVSTPLVAGVFPIGITQHDALAGEEITLCVSGYTSVIAELGLSAGERGSVILGPSATNKDGKCRTGQAPASTEGRIGFLWSIG
jgi:hypothetical protein